MLMADSPNTPPTVSLNTRRSQRVVSSIPVQVRKRTVSNGSITEVSYPGHTPAPRCCGPFRFQSPNGFLWAKHEPVTDYASFTLTPVDTMSLRAVV